MIKLFGQTDKSYLTNGDVVLLPFKAKVRKEDNGAFYLDLETGIEYADELTAGRIIVANTPQGDQAFRIGDYNDKRIRNKIDTGSPTTWWLRTSGSRRFYSVTVGGTEAEVYVSTGEIGVVIGFCM